MKKLIIEIDDQCYEDVINDTEWDTLSDVLSFAIYLNEIVKEGKPLQAELEEIKGEIKNMEWYINSFKTHNKVIEILDKRIKELNNDI